MDVRKLDDSPGPSVTIDELVTLLGVASARNIAEQLAAVGKADVVLDKDGKPCGYSFRVTVPCR